tara:strand:- start:456 stop:1340 length:885 start_codon:yes stop_codon:yes gene_type:complete
MTKGKIDFKYLEIINSRDPNLIFGDWINNINYWSEKFAENKSKYVIIKNFLNSDIIKKVNDSFPSIDDSWYKYWNPIEVKYANDKINSFPSIIKDVFYFLSSNIIKKKISKICGIPNLEIDEYLHGAGLHAHPRNGRLNIHLDYEKHPITNKQRRLNIILYLSKNWKPEWNGHTELYDDNYQNLIAKSPVVFNQAIIFKTNENSWHGLPEKIQCPENVYRKSLAYYYVSDLENSPNKKKQGANKNGYRIKAVFVQKFAEKRDIRIQKLLKIRPNRRITKEDLEKIWADWNEIDN